VSCANLDHPSISNTTAYWWFTLLFIRLSLITKQPIGTFSLSSYPEQTSHTSFCIPFQAGNMTSRTVSRRLSESSRGLPYRSAVKLNLTDILTTASFLLQSQGQINCKMLSDSNRWTQFHNNNNHHHHYKHQVFGLCGLVVRVSGYR
jgi:hypothetical protein